LSFKRQTRKAEKEIEKVNRISRETQRTKGEAIP
jgi:hypothetical protein